MYVFLSLFKCHVQVQSQMGSVHGSAGQTVACRSILGDAREATPLVLPTRGDLEDIKAMMQGDVYIGRGCRQRGLSTATIMMLRATADNQP